MKETLLNLLDWLWSGVPRETEFWSAIVGAVVGGAIAVIGQVMQSRAAKKQQHEDHRRVQQALGNSLLFKMLRIHSNFWGIHRHIEECFEGAEKKGWNDAEPWQIFLPLANSPDPVNFSADEMGMLLGLKDNDVFNVVQQMDVIHNDLTNLVKLLGSMRSSLAHSLTAEQFEGTLANGYLAKEQLKALRPRMIEVNLLVENIRERAKKDFDESAVALDGLNAVLCNHLGLTYKLESKVRPAELSQAA